MLVVPQSLRGLRRLRRRLGSYMRVMALRYQFPGLQVKGRVRIAPGVNVYVGRESRLVLDNVFVSRGVTLTTSPGAELSMQADFIGPGSVIVARKRVRVGPGSQIAEGVTIRDANHDTSASLSEGKFVVSAVIIGGNVWLGAKCTVLAGVTIGRDAVVGAGAVVTRNVTEGATVVGVPARRID